ncbi:MAG: WbqC family protein [Alphaproteobacteria bacterium]|nr:WbqC family protein [Alphaproteobacteria bacterium]
MVKTAVIIQSNYIPWRGYFDLIGQADELLILDNVQYTKQDWRNRNIIKTAKGPQWITIPVLGHFGQAIDQVRIAEPRWFVKHVRTLETNYRKAAAYDSIAPWLFNLYSDLAGEKSLSACNWHLIAQISAKLGITTPMRRADEILPRQTMSDAEPTQRLVELCQAVGATRYLSGPSARTYMDMARFRAAGVDVVWMDYEGYPDYPQLGDGFLPHVSVVDLLFNCGDRASDYLAPRFAASAPTTIPQTGLRHASLSQK